MQRFMETRSNVALRIENNVSLLDRPVCGCSIRAGSSSPFCPPEQARSVRRWTFPGSYSRSWKGPWGSSVRRDHPRSLSRRRTGSCVGRRRRRRLRGTRTCSRCKGPGGTSGENNKEILEGK
jgi:hypothetical protein